MKAAIRPYETRDFPAALSLVQGPPDGRETIERLMPLLATEGTVSVVAEDGGTIVGIAVGVAAGGTGWVAGVVSNGEDTLTRLVDAVEIGLADGDVRRIVVVAPAGSELERRGYTS